MGSDVVRGRVAGRVVLVALIAAAATALSGCAPEKSSQSGGLPGSTAAKASAQPVSLSISPSNGSSKLRPDTPIRITVGAGTLASVVVTPQSGSPLKGELNSDQTVWTNTGALKNKMGYTIKVTAKDADGRTTDSTSTFSTMQPSSTATASVYPTSGMTVGVGMPIIFTLSRPVAKAQQAGVEKGLRVTTEPSSVHGGFHWFSSTQVQWRPAVYWPAHTKVHVASALSGIQIDKGVWGATQTDHTDFTIGSSMISTVDIAGHHMQVRQDGKLIRTIPVTTGKASLPTRNGIKVIMTKEYTHQMNSETIGIDKDDPDYYNLTVHYAMRLTYSGEFLHAAPWSVGSQGAANVSHGCTGMSTSNARWMFDHSKVGDVVKYKNGHRKLETGNGYTAWNIPLSQWH